MPTIMPPVIALLLLLPRRRAPRRDKSLIQDFIRISALEVLAKSFDFISPPISETHPLLRIVFNVQNCACTKVAVPVTIRFESMPASY
jgi:hypothetical protein